MECSLEKGELIRLDGGKNGLVLHCMAGTLWLTTGDGRDHLIKAGSGFEVPVDKVALAEALETAEFRLGETLPADSMLHKPLTGFVAC
jgi:quercetin dioxygenase-like cupin family protein